VYTESPVSAARSTLDRLAVPWTPPGWRSISATSVLNILRSQPWWSTVLTWDTTFNFIIPPSSPLRPNTWIALLERPLKLSPTLTIWTERWVFVSASHGSLSSAASRNLMPDLQGYTGPCTVSSLVRSLLEKWPPGMEPCFPPQLDPNPTSVLLPPCPLSTLTLPSLHSWFPMWPCLSPFLAWYSSSFILTAQSAATCSCRFLAHRFFYLKMEAIRSSKMWVHTRTTWRHNTENSFLQVHFPSHANCLTYLATTWVATSLALVTLHGDFLQLPNIDLVSCRFLCISSAELSLHLQQKGFMWMCYVLLRK
jgi:hypothetical protein